MSRDLILMCTVGIGVAGEVRGVLGNAEGSAGRGSNLEGSITTAVRVTALPNSATFFPFMMQFVCV